MEGNQLQLDHDQMKVLMNLQAGEDFTEGETVVAVYWMGGMDVSEGTLEDNGYDELSYSLGDMACSVEPAYHIVLRNDFVKALEAAGLMYPLTTV